MEYPILEAIENMPEKPHKYLRVDKTYPEWQIGETYTGKIKFMLVQQDLTSSLFEIIDFIADDEPSRTDAEKLAQEMSPKAKAIPIIVPSPSE